MNDISWGDINWLQVIGTILLWEYLKFAIRNTDHTGQQKK